MAEPNPLEVFRTLTDPAEQEFVRSKRGLVENEDILTQLDAFRAQRAAEAPPPEPTPPLDPHYEAWLTEAKRLNPDYPDENLKEIYDRTYAEKDADLISYEDFLKQAKPLNPDYSDAQIRSIWEEQYASRGALEENPGFTGTLLEGARQTGRSIKAFGQALAGDTAGAEQTAEASTSAPRDPALVRLLRDINRRKEELGPDAPWYDAGAAVGKALLNDPKGAALLLTEQLPNSVAALGSAGTGALAGGMLTGPPGAVVGGLAGLFLADVALETGGKVIEKAQGGLTPDERLEALDEGLQKGAIIAGIDAATFGATKWLTGAASRAMERATITTLEREGIDVTDKTAVELARQRPEIVDKVQAAQKEALQGVSTLGQKTARGTSEVALQTIGEGAGEYIGELVATGHGDKVEAFIEAFAGLGQSIGEISIAGTMDSKRAVTTLFGAGNEAEKPEIQNILKQGTVDDAIKSAGAAVGGDQVPVTPEAIDQFIGAATTKPGAYTDSHYSADQTIANQFFATLKEAGHRVNDQPDGSMIYRGVTSRVIHPSDLPDERGVAGFVTRGQYEAIDVALQAMGKHLIVLDAPLGQFEGGVYRAQFPNTVFLSNKTDNDPVVVAFHEVGHLMQGKPLYEAFQQTVQEELQPGAKTLAKERHPVAGGRKLLNEMSADILGDAMLKPEFMEKVFKNLQLQVGPEAAQKEVTGFLEKLKDMIVRVKNAVLGHTFLAKDGREVATAYVNNLERVYDSLAKAVAAEFTVKPVTPAEETKPLEKVLPLEPRKEVTNEKEVRQEKVLAESTPPSVEDIHRLAEQKGVAWDNAPGFMALTKAVTGKEHLDDLTAPERKRVVDVLTNLQDRLPTTQEGKEGLTNEDVQEKEGQVSPEPVTLDDAARDVNPEPTEPQKEAGNYKKGHIKVAGLDISIENPEGSTRRGVDRTGRAWSQKMKSHYGYVRGTKGRDKDHIDVFVKPGLDETYNGTAYVVDQIDPTTKRFDEHKILLGASSPAEAKKMYQEHYTKGWQGLGAISPMSMDQLKAWLKGDTTTPVAYQEKKDLIPTPKKKDVGLIPKAQTETIEPLKDTFVGENAAGEKLYERASGERYRMRTDRKDRPEGYPDFGGDLAPTLPKNKRTFQRYEDGADPVGSPNKPHGLYVSPEGIDSPHKELGGTRSTWKLDEDAKVLSVHDYGKETSLRKGADGADAGVNAARMLLEKETFDLLKAGSKADAIAYANENYPGPDYTKYYDKQEVIAAIGAQEARKQGYDALYAPDDPAMAKFRGDFTEVVLLNETKAHRTDTKDQGLLAKPLPPEEKPAPVTTTRSVSAVTKDILTREGELFDQGVDLTKMYNPLDPRDAVLASRKGYTAMPEDLGKLYLEREAAQDQSPQFSPRVIPAVPYTVSEPGKLDNVIRKLQDKNIDIKRMVEAIQQSGGNVPTQLNPVLREEVYQKRAEIRSEDYKNQELIPLIDAMRENKVSLQQLNDYLHARHVIIDRVNERLQAMNPDMPNNEALSGLSDTEARKILNSYTGERKATMDALAARVDAMVEKTRDLMVNEYGLEKADTIAGWRKTYKAYVPLRREAFEEEGHPTGTGRSVRGSTAQDRLGSNLKVSNILANIAQARDQVITRGEKMRPVIAMAGLLMLHPNKDIAVLDKPAPVTMTDPATGLEITVPGDLANYKMPKIRKIDHETGEVKWYPDPSFKGHENVVNFRIKGVDYAIVFNEKNIRAREMAKAFRDLDTGTLSGALKAVAPYTRYLASVNTQYNPIFGIVNFVRDAQFAMLTLASTPLAGKQATILNNARKSMIGIFQDARDARHGLPPSSATAHLWERFQHVGGPTGYRDLFFTATDRANEIERLLNPNSWKHIRSPQDFGRRMEETFLFRLLSDYNLMMENAIRLGVFKTAVEMGVDDLQAASYAKNITVNFNKKGQIGAQMGALYAFFNANVQGTARILDTIWERDPNGRGLGRLSSAGKKIVSGGILLGILQASLLALSGFEEDEPPEFVKEKNFVIPAPGTEKGYLMIPMPLGFNLLPNVGRVAAETIFAGAHGKDPRIFKKGADLFHTILSSLSPTGGTGSAALELSPTVADPLLSLEMNKDWTGKKISQEDFSSLKPTPGHSRARPNATVWATGLSKMINWATGGTDYTPGVLSPTPDAIDYLIQQATGGVGREFSKTAQVAQAAQTGEDVPLYKYPLIGRFTGSATGTAAIRDRFYENIRSINLAAEEVKGRALHHEERAEFIKDHPEAAFEQAAVKMQRAIGELQDAKRLAIDRGEPKDAIKLREERISALMQQFNAAVERRKVLR